MDIFYALLIRLLSLPSLIDQFDTSTILRAVDVLQVCTAGGRHSGSGVLQPLDNQHLGSNLSLVSPPRDQQKHFHFESGD